MLLVNDRNCVPSVLCVVMKVWGIKSENEVGKSNSPTQCVVTREAGEAAHYQ